MFSRAPARLRVFGLVNGRRSAKAIAKEASRQLTNTLRDLQALRDVGLIELKLDEAGRSLKKDGSFVYEKAPVARHVPMSYFQRPARIEKKAGTATARKSKALPLTRPVLMPTE